MLLNTRDVKSNKNSRDTFLAKKKHQKSVNFNKSNFATKHRKLPVNHINLKDNVHSTGADQNDV